ncbi:unnamed protein product, partial [Polarella glacialis]
VAGATEAAEESCQSSDFQSCGLEAQALDLLLRLPEETLARVLATLLRSKSVGDSDDQGGAMSWQLAFFFLVTGSFVLRLARVLLSERSRHRRGAHKQGDFRPYLSYRFGYWYAWTPGSAGIVLCGLSFGLMLIGGIVLSTFTGEPVSSALWSAWCWIAAPDGGGSADSSAGRMVGVVMSCGGMLIFALLMSVVSSSFEDMLAALRDGVVPIVEANHLVILGWGPVALPLIRELCLGAESRGGNVIAILTPMPKPDIEELLRESEIDFLNSTICVRSGLANRVEDLTKVAIESAQSVIVLSDAKLSRECADSKTLNTLLTLQNQKWPREDCNLIVECQFVRNQRLFESLCHCSVLTTGDFVGRLMVQSSQQHGLSSVIDATFGFEGDEFYIEPVKGSAGRTFQELLFGLQGVVVVGILRPGSSEAEGSQCELLPPMARVLVDGEQLIMLAEDAAMLPTGFGAESQQRAAAMALTFSAALAASAANNNNKNNNNSNNNNSNNSNNNKNNNNRNNGSLALESEEQKQTIIVIGWNDSMGALMDEIDKDVGKGSEVIIFASQPTDEREKFLDSAQQRRKHRYQNVSVEQRQGNLGARYLLEDLPLCTAHKVMILADASAESASEADDRTLAIILQVKDILHEQVKDDVIIIPQILQSHAEEACRQMGLRDWLSSNQLAAKILALVSESPAMNLIISQILAESGCHFHIRKLPQLIPHTDSAGADKRRTVSFDEISVAAVAAGELAIGWSKASVEGDSRVAWDINPKEKAKGCECTADCRVVVLRHVCKH